MKKRKVAICGLGAAARGIHIPACREIDGLEIVGGYDPSPDGHAFPFPLFSSLKELLNRVSADILIVANPPAWHFESTREGLLAGCHVLCEKPFVESLEEASEIVSLSERLGRWVVVNHQFRFMNIHQQAKRAIGTPEFGDLMFLAAHQTFRTTRETEAGWRALERRRTCKDFGIHVLDLCRFFFEEDPREVYARMPRPGKPEGPDYLNLIQLEFSGDRVAHIILDRLCKGPQRYLDLRLDGSRSSIETHLGGGFEVCAGVRGGTRLPFFRAELSWGGWARQSEGSKSRKIASDPLDVFRAATRFLIRAFLDALETGAVPVCHAEDSRRSLAIMLAAYESHKKSRPIKMKY